MTQGEGTRVAGTMVAHTGDMGIGHDELPAARTVASSDAWASSSVLLPSNGVKRATFLCKVLEAVLAGTRSFTFFDSKLCGFMRSLMGGMAHWQEWDGNHRSFTKLQLFQQALGLRKVLG